MFLWEAAVVVDFFGVDVMAVDFEFVGWYYYYFVPLEWNN